ncbi:hypothetical protein NDU88_004702 [Pleurodeles waltl]|uniref:Secreted protein n=1 Tax=Pleurodeles waltl TaxID=8319 RepID=A0AAV7PGJ8_PLEWA|nr:hypothetical protein NDU88_004702 [Pleurodeles waltl]
MAGLVHFSWLGVIGGAPWDRSPPDCCGGPVCCLSCAAGAPVGERRGAGWVGPAVEDFPAVWAAARLRGRPEEAF